VPRDAGLASLLHLVETDVAILRHAHYQPGASISSHRHDRASLVYGVGGPCFERNALGPLARRRLTFLPDGHEHALEHRGAAHVLAIEIAPKWLLQACGGHIPDQILPLPATLYDLVWDVMLNVVGRAPPAALNASLLALVQAAVDFARKSPSPLVIALMEELHVHWKDVPSVARLAQKYSLSAQYICRVFKRTTGIAMQQYGLLVRLDHARALLWGSDLPIADVAAETGFADQSHLTRALAEHSARTPLRLRSAAPCRKSIHPAAYFALALER